MVTNPRKEFLLALFRTLEGKQVRYVVVRNYDDIFESTTSDVDLAVETEQVGKLIQCLAEAAVATGHVEVLRARYVNYSYVFFHSQGALLRIDVETETRWRIFPVLSAKAIVGLRRKYGEFYVPHPRHESAILFAASIWRGSLSERYRMQLSRLHDQLNDPEQLRRCFRAIFGRAGDDLAEYQSKIADSSPPLDLKAIRNALITRALGTGPNRRAMAHYFAVDLRRFFYRVLHPPGISLLFISSAKPAWDLHALLERIEFLYPIEKTTLYHFDRLSNVTRTARLTWKLRMERLWTLFKGGLFIRFYQTHTDDEISHLIKTHTRHLFPSRTFVCTENSRNEIILAHVGTGLMAQFESREEELSREGRMLKFITDILNRNGNEKKNISDQSKTRGAFIVLLGLDGSGKTTIARELCCLAGQMHQFRAVRYFHWRPSLLRQSVFPLSSATHTPRKDALPPNAFRSLVSALRLFKNLLLTRLAWWLNVRKQLCGKTLVIMDRYFYNYYLDPASVRYYGPSWLVDRVSRAFPKPDLLFVLSAPPATLLARKQELSEQQILQQSVALQKLALNAPNSIVVDATRPAAEVAREIFSRITTVHASDQKNEPVAAP